MSFIGMNKFDLDTPTYCIDLDVLETNIQKMAKTIIGKGMQWRPHEKCHKTPAIAWKQIQAGAIGVTCAKVSEAEVMAAAGIRDILIANMIVGEKKWERVASLCRSADPIIAVDHFAQAEPLAQICHKHGVAPRVIIEMDIGLNRVGARPGSHTLELAQAISKLKGVKFVGVMGYEGHLLSVEDQAEKRKQIFSAMDMLIQSRDAMVKSGVCCDIVSAGGTGSFQITSDYTGGVTELQAGGGIFADPLYRNHMALKDLDYSLSVLATVVSRPALDRAVLDSGRKTLNPDHEPPVVKGRPDAKMIRMSAEHCELSLGKESQNLKIGDKIELIPGYADFTTVMHDQFFGFRGDRLEAIWPILGRGKLQ